MKSVFIIASPLLLIALMAGAAGAQEGSDQSMFPGLSGEVQFTGQGVTGKGQSAKFEEYREVPQGGSADWLKLDFENETATYFFDLRVIDAAQDDMTLDFGTGEYGKWKLDFKYNRIPHRFHYDVTSLYSGVGTDYVSIADQIQNDLQNSQGPPPAPPAAAPTTLAAAMLRGLADQSPNIGDIGLERERFDLNLAYNLNECVTLGVDLFYENRDGTRRIGGGFGFGNALQLPEPIDYDTYRPGIWVAYDQDWFHARLGYEYEHFRNNIGSLSFDNPFRSTDSAGQAIGGVIPGAISVLRNNGYSNNWVSGARFGEMDLYPSNWMHSVSLDTSAEIGWDTELQAGAMAGWRGSDDELLAWTTNTAMVAGVGYEPDNLAATNNDGDEYIIPFNANDKANLPDDDFNGRVDTQRYTLGLTNRAIDNLEVRARWRGYNSDNDSERLDFPGYVRVDAVWEEEEWESERHSFWRQNGGIDFAYDLGHETTVTAGYGFEQWDRWYLRETDVNWSHTALCALDSGAVEWMDVKGSYEHTWRDGDYDFRAPFQGGDEETTPPQLPFLRKYDEGDKERDKGTVQLTFYPCDMITPTVGYSAMHDDYDTNFGLTDELRQQVNVGFDADPWERLHFDVYGSLEWADMEQGARNWNPSGGVGDPYTVDTGEFSNSNWDAISRERVVTIGANTVFTVVLEKLFWENTYTYAHATEHIDLDSPIDTVAPIADNNLRDLRLLELSDADDSNSHALKSQFRWVVRNNLTILIGYQLDTFSQDNYRYRDYVPVPTANNGSYSGFYGWGNFDPPDYISHMGFVGLLWEF